MEWLFGSSWCCLNEITPPHTQKKTSETGSQKQLPQEFPSLKNQHPFIFLDVVPVDRDDMAIIYPHDAVMTRCWLMHRGRSRSLDTFRSNGHWLLSFEKTPRGMGSVWVRWERLGIPVRCVLCILMCSVFLKHIPYL